MKKKNIRFIIILALSLFIGTQLYASGTDAKTTKTDAIAAFTKLLQKGEFSYKDEYGSRVVKIQSYCLLDIDQNGVTELIVKEVPAEEIGVRYVFYAKGKKAVYAGDYFEKGYYTVQYSKKHKAIAQSWTVNQISGAGACLMRLKNGKLKSFKYVYESQESSNSTKMVYMYGSSEKNAKKVSKKTYDAAVKKYFDFSKMKEISFE